MAETNLNQTSQLGCDWWNDSCSILELSEAVKEGAVGATSNPVIVTGVLEQDPDRWNPVLDNIIRQNPQDTEDEIAWRLIERIGKDASQLLMPVYEKTQGQKGYLSMQVNPKFYPNTAKMVDHAKTLAAIAPNIAIKAPATRAGIDAMEEMTAKGIRVNATVCFSVSQAVAAAEAIQRGMKRAVEYGISTDKLRPNVTIMVGRVEDQLKRQSEAQNIQVDQDMLQWSGVAVFKKAYQVFKNRDFSSQLLVAAYRNDKQWNQLIGENVSQTIPYKWWKSFNEAKINVTSTIETPVDENVINTLSDKFTDFRKAYLEEGMRPDEFVSFGGTVHTLNQFLGGYDKLLQAIRKRMLTF